MTSRQLRSILVVLFLMLGLFLVACERPMPGDNELLPTNTPAETASNLLPETTPIQQADGAEETSETEENEVDEADLIQPADGDTVESEVPEGDASENDTDDDGDAAGSDASDSDAAEGDTAESDTAESDAAESDAAESDAAEGEEVAQTEEAENDGADSSEETPAVATGRTHTVAAGENLFRISMQYGISWVTLAQVNGLSNADSIAVGQVLIIPDEEITETSETADPSEAPLIEDTIEDAEGPEEQEPVESDPVEAASEETTYIVQSGDNLYRISLQFGVSMMEIARTNDLVDFNQVFDGQELIIPQADADESPDIEPIDEEVTHLVQGGETVFGIAFQYGIAWTKLVDANEIPSPYNLEVGQSLIIPSSE